MKSVSASDNIIHIKHLSSLNVLVCSLKIFLGNKLLCEGVVSKVGLLVKGGNMFIDYLCFPRQPGYSNEKRSSYNL